MSDNNGIQIRAFSKETLAYHKVLLIKINLMLEKRKSSALPLISLGRRIQKIARMLNPLKPIFLKLGSNAEVVLIKPEQYKSIQMLKLMFEHIVAEEEKRIADGCSEADELEFSK